jgi:hypothetical protein
MAKAQPAAAADTTPAEAVSQDPIVPTVPESLAEYPGRTMGVVALVLAFFHQIPALILGIIAWVWSQKAGYSNTPAKVAVAVSAALMVLGLIAIIGWIALLVSLGDEFGRGFMGEFGPDFPGGPFSD